MLSLVLFLLINVLHSHDHTQEKYFYDMTLPEVFADFTPEEKQEIEAKLKEIQQLQEQIDALIKIKREHQKEDLLTILLTPKNQLKENQQ